MIYNSKMEAQNYFPPMLGNGDMTFSVDSEGGINHGGNDFGNVQGFDGVIYRSGRRLAPNYKNKSDILSFGKLWFDAGSAVSEFEQELDVKSGVVNSTCSYENGAVIRTQAFIHPELALYCVQKTLVTEGTINCNWSYHLCGYNTVTDDAIRSKTYNGNKLSFLLDGNDKYKGELFLHLDTPYDVSNNDDIVLSFVLESGKPVSFFLYLGDDMDGCDYLTQNADITQKIEDLGYDGLLSENKKGWKEFFDKNYVITPDDTLNNIYETALFHLKCYTTKWSIPVGLNNKQWNGCFFAFDEYYSLLGLLGANHPELAKHVPEFRLNVCFPLAIKRQTCITDEQARFCWLTGEHGEELAPVGYWMDHVFHMAVIALGAYEYYEYSGDIEFLERCYPMIRACAKFYTLHMIYENNGNVIVGKCTDLERLGSSIENPLMTSCGVIKTLEITASAAEILGIDSEYRVECLMLAAKLRKTLPSDGVKYLPYIGANQKSIGVFSCKFPFDVISDNDPKMLAAWQDFVDNGSAFGNMYATGKRLSPWYACWQAEGFARIGDGENAYGFLKCAYESVGVFAEMFEINEPAVRLRPWFTTAAGIYLSTVNEMLVQSDGETIRLLPAFPLSDVSFKLAVKGGAVIEATISGGELTSVQLYSNEPKTMKLIYKDQVRILSAVETKE